MIELDEAKTGFAYVLQAYKTGGPYMHLITIFALLAVTITVWKIVEMFRKKTLNTRLLGLIRMAGILAVATGFFSQIVGIVLALEAIKAAADVSPQIVMNGAIVSFYAPIWGFIVFIFSMIIYFILKEIIKAKMPENN